MENGCGCPRAGRDVEGSTPGLDEIELESTVYQGSKADGRVTINLLIYIDVSSVLNQINGVLPARRP